MSLTTTDKAYIKQVKERNTMRKNHRNHKLMPLQDKARNKTKMYLSLEDKRNMNKVCNNSACLLHSYYVDLAESTSKELTDKYLAEVTGWAVSTVQKNRLALEKANWFRKYTVTGGRNNKYSVTYYLLHTETVISDMEDDEYITLLQESMKDMDESVVKDIMNNLKIKYEESF